MEARFFGVRTRLSEGLCWRGSFLCVVVKCCREAEAKKDPSSSASLREVGAYSDPPSSLQSPGREASVSFAVAGFWSRRGEAFKAPRCRLGFEGLQSRRRSRCITDGTRRREDKAFEERFKVSVGGLSVSKLRRKLLLCGEADARKLRQLRRVPCERSRSLHVSVSLSCSV
ncbi:unnamed protein product [Eruca vesicaria subsp. sativa]|uniref:Uncharacterized protein n=1 Tax=Eruca vesicaria subsp. sativa TaxID=29727 RepID=A0ABC8M2K2_ERUVS|nr:unnamed protein product [Eruca vesicaria subsp. sativa]